MNHVIEKICAAELKKWKGDISRAYELPYARYSEGMLTPN